MTYQSALIINRRVFVRAYLLIDQYFCGFVSSLSIMSVDKDTEAAL